MRQLLLDLLPAPPPPSLENFVSGRNSALLQTLRTLASSPPGSMQAIEERLHYLWGNPGCGKTHLLLALREPQAIWLDRLAAPETFVFQGAQRYLVDDVTQLSPAQQDAVFALYNQIRTDPHAQLLVSGPCAPLELATLAPTMRADLRTRLGALLVWQVQALTDAEIATALTQTAQQRGLQLHPEVVPWLLTHQERSMSALMAWLDALDRYSLERQRAAITLPLVRALLTETAAYNN